MLILYSLLAVVSASTTLYRSNLDGVLVYQNQCACLGTSNVNGNPSLQNPVVAPVSSGYLPPLARPVAGNAPVAGDSAATGNAPAAVPVVGTGQLPAGASIVSAGQYITVYTIPQVSISVSLLIVVMLRDATPVITTSTVTFTTTQFVSTLR